MQFRPARRRSAAPIPLPQLCLQDGAGVAERDDFLRIVIALFSFCLRMIFAQTLRVCREGKPVPTPHQVRGRHFPDHACGRHSPQNRRGLRQGS
jgi:hypothetical protein